MFYNGVSRPSGTTKVKGLTPEEVGLQAATELRKLEEMEVRWRSRGV